MEVNTMKTLKITLITFAMLGTLMLGMQALAAEVPVPLSSEDPIIPYLNKTLKRR
jgi:hypothetical protein